MLRWLKGAGAGRRAVADMQARIPPELWARVLQAFPFLDLPDPQDAQQLLARTAWVLASKTMNGARGMALTDYERLAIAAQAALPILRLPPSLYEGWEEIIVYPGGFRIPRRREDEAGVVHEYIEEAAGEAWDGGPVILSWETDQPGSVHAYNVVIHEFAHKLDLQSGQADGMPALDGRPDLSPRLWRQVLASSLDTFVQALEEVEASIPPDVDPESPEADPWYARLPLDPYAATDEAEFFAVSSESFFTAPQALAAGLPDWYALLAAYYRQDPLARLASEEGPTHRPSGDPALAGTEPAGRQRP